ncbi:hypothetical protein KUTeg_006985 [Tegillarca granosa]|uniref:Origin recognition complex subunit 3 winged helix C-terminal domain-containing protein n=1 Tax=Tegillarca granosa TaxID=220873 RepID=A0ABQ9FGM1_TEGGR|nr:hypothetical protein KUTeg_006985 [Tegillarca granosa]
MEFHELKNWNDSNCEILLVTTAYNFDYQPLLWWLHQKKKVMNKQKLQINYYSILFSYKGECMFIYLTSYFMFIKNRVLTPLNDIYFWYQARFIRAVSELQFLGFVKPTKRKTDHVARLTWGGYYSYYIQNKISVFVVKQWLEDLHLHNSFHFL